jgi:DNA polymerase III subunit alpha
VRGRVDHKDASKTCLVVQSVEPFRPTAAEVESAREKAAARSPAIPQPVTVTLDARSLPATVFDELKHVFENFPGETEVVLAISTEDGSRTLRLGPEYRVSPTPSLRAELANILGPSALGTQAA